MVPGGVTPNMSSTEAKQAGFKIIIYPGLMLSAVYDSCSAASAEFKSIGTVKVSERMKREGPKGLFVLYGLDECLGFDKKAGGQAYSKGM